jgi:hypothetical protein
VKQHTPWFLLLIFALLFGVSATLSAAAPPQPTYGETDVDGQIGEWDLNYDYFADMTRWGTLGKPVDTNSICDMTATPACSTSWC